MKTLSGGQLAGGNSTTEKADNDFYSTDPSTVRLFLDVAKDEFENVNLIWENAAGDGNISKTLPEYFNSSIISTDLVDRGFCFSGIDFLNDNMSHKPDLIITNPPFSLINEFIVKGLEKTNRYLVYLCKIQMLESVKRKTILENSPLKYVYVHSTRQATWKDGQPLDTNGKKWATTMCLAWFVWDKEYTGEPIIRFI